MEITIKIQQKKIPLSPPQIKKITQKILNKLGVRKGFLSLAFVTDRQIKSLNRQYLNRDHTTDVLAFDLRDNPAKSRMEGEVIISATTAWRNAKEFNTTPYHEVILYIIHGILHLIGYDDHKSADIKRMRKKEADLMKYIQPHLQS